MKDSIVRLKVGVVKKLLTISRQTLQKQNKGVLSPPEENTNWGETINHSSWAKYGWECYRSS